jgi:hypothetical protein
MKENSKICDTIDKKSGSVEQGIEKSLDLVIIKVEQPKNNKLRDD